MSNFRVIRQRRIFRWLNSQKSQTARRQRQLERERRRPDLFQKQEVVEVQKDETIDEQNEEIDVMGIWKTLKNNSVSQNRTAFSSFSQIIRLTVPACSSKYFRILCFFFAWNTTTTIISPDLWIWWLACLISESFEVNSNEDYELVIHQNKLIIITTAYKLDSKMNSPELFIVMVVDFKKMDHLT